MDYYHQSEIAPYPPQNLIATPGDNQATLTWSPNSDNDFASYRIYGGTTENPTTVVDSTTSIEDTTKTITGLTNGITYYYRIKAVDLYGYESDYSNEVSVTPFYQGPTWHVSPWPATVQVH